jgi:radical SAM protein with 4Fe4S-binding SPASM domain
VKHTITGTPDAKAVSQLRRRFAVSKTLARRDLEKVRKSLARLGRAPDKDPLESLVVDASRPTEMVLDSPLHFYINTTYDDPDRPVLDTVPPERSVGVLSRREWEIVFERMEKIGVHYITFCGGEPTARDDLEQFIRTASSKGMAVGLETNGARLSDKGYLDRLIRAGLDAVTFKFNVSNPKLFKKMNRSKRKGFYKDTVKGLRNALAADVEVQAFVLLTKTTVVHLPETVALLKKEGVRTVMLGLLPQSNPDLFLESSIGEEHMGALLDLVAGLGGGRTRVLMKTPVGVTQGGTHPGLPVVDCSGAYTNMALEPNGDVLVCRYLFQPLGNILANEWDAIWNHPNAAKVRNREDLPDRCGQCPDLVLCGGGCPEWQFFLENQTDRDYVVVEVERKR